MVLYTRNGCHLCETAKEILLKLMDECPFDYEERDISLNDDWTERYGLMIPVVEIDGKEVQYGQVDKKFIYETLTKK
nr:glutaredoxin family protein [Bacillus benzoevorans]